jgi:hypothetical protein
MDSFVKNSINTNNKSMVVTRNENLKSAQELSDTDFRKAIRSDESIDRQAKYTAYSEYNDSSFRNVTKGVALGLPVVDTYVSGVMTNGSASTKASAAMSKAANWGTFIGTAMLYNRLADALIDKVPAMKKFRDDHPLETTAGVVLSGAYISAKAIEPVNKLLVQASNSKPAKEIISKTKDLANRISSSRPEIKNVIEQKVLTPSKNFINNHSQALGLGAKALIGGVLIKEIIDIAGIKSRENQERRKLEREKLNSALSYVHKTLSKKQDTLPVSDNIFAKQA